MILFLAVLSSCSNMSVQRDEFFTMDTFCETTVLTKKPESGKEANERIREICDEVEGRISNTIKTSEIYRLNNKLIEIADLSKETAGLLEIAKDMSEQTNGAFNPNLGEIIDLWGINKNSNHKLPEIADFYPALDRAQNYRGNFDLGGIGKGYAADKISDYLVGAGISNALVSFSSSILAVGKNKSGNLWSIGVKDPLYPDKLCGYLNATDKFISVSGGYERFITIDGINYCHIIDPETGYPVDNDLLCVIVVINSQSALQKKSQREEYKNNGALSDALSTALYVMGKEKALDFYAGTHLDFEMILFVKDENSKKGYDIIPTNVIFNEIR